MPEREKEERKREKGRKIDRPTGKEREGKGRSQKENLRHRGGETNKTVFPVTSATSFLGTVAQKWTTEEVLLFCLSVRDPARS